MRYFCYFKAYTVFNFIPSFSFKVNETATLQLRKLKYNRLCFLYKDIVLIGAPTRGMHMTKSYDLTAREVSWCPKRSFLTLNFMFSSCFLRNCLIWRFLRGSDSKESACNAGDLCLIPGSGRFPWGRKWLLTPIFLLGDFHEQRSLADICGVAKSRAQLSN